MKNSFFVAVDRKIGNVSICNSLTWKFYLFVIWFYKFGKYAATVRGGPTVYQALYCEVATPVSRTAKIPALMGLLLLCNNYSVFP